MIHSDIQHLPENAEGLNPKSPRIAKNANKRVSETEKRKVFSTI